MKLYLCCIEFRTGYAEGFGIDEDGNLLTGCSGCSKEETKKEMMGMYVPPEYEKEWVELKGNKVTHKGLIKALKKSQKKEETFYLHKLFDF